MINQNIPLEQPNASVWMEQINGQISSTHSVLRACMGWVFALGVTPEMPFYQKKNLALINRVAFISMLLALPGTFLLILLGISHPFSVLLMGVLMGCAILALNGARRVKWSKGLFAFGPAVMILTYTLVELSLGRMTQAAVYLLARQGICFALLLPMIIYGFEEREKVLGILGFCALLLMIFNIGSAQLGVFQEDSLSGLSNGLVSLLSLLQYMGLAGCILYMQGYTMQQERQVSRSQEKFKDLAIKDGMTGLFNHTFMQQLIGDAINRSRRSRNPLAILMIDIDFFKGVNDTFGHNAGDEVLMAISRLLTRNKRTTDYLGRWGGDELILLLTNTNLAGAVTLAEKLRTLVNGHIFPYIKQLTVSMGIGEYQDGDTPASFIARADAALYRAKRAGRNRVAIQS